MLSKLRYITSWNITLFFNVLGTSALGHGGVIGTRFTLLSKTGRKQDTIVKITIFRHCTESSVRLMRGEKVRPTISSPYCLEAISLQGAGIQKRLATLQTWAGMNIQGPILEKMFLHGKGEFQRSTKGSLWLNTNLYICERKLTGWRVKYKKAASWTISGFDI